MKVDAMIARGFQPVEVDDDFTEQYGGVDVELPEFETPHRYPVVTDRDWCSHYKEES